MDRAITIVPLADILRPDDKEASEYVRRILSEFQCERNGIVNHDVVSFIASRAIDFEENHICRTFLAIDSDALSFGELKVYGYFALQAIGTEPDPDAVAGLNSAMKEMLDASSGVINGMLLVQLLFVHRSYLLLFCVAGH